MNDLRFFDAHCYIGRYKTFRPGSFYTVDDLVQQMHYFGISEALVTHAMSREHHPVDGNGAVLVEIKNHPNLHPSWALLPPASKELALPAMLISEMVASGVKAAKIFYGSYFFPISDWCMGEVFDELEAHRVLTFLDPDVELGVWEKDRFDWDRVDALCRSHSKLPVILSESRFRASSRPLYQLMDRHRNLHVEISGYWAHHGIEFIVREFGADRLIFGTRMPVRNPACAVAQVAYANISDDDKRMIAGDNLRNLLKGVIE